MRHLWILLILAGSAFGVTNTFFAPAAAGGNTGADCANARAISSYVGGDSGADKTVILCAGTYTSTFTLLGSSGTSGHPTGLTLQAGANFSKASWGGSTVIEIANRDWVIVDFSATGQIFNNPLLDTWVAGGKIENTNVSSTNNPTVNTSAIDGIPTNNSIVRNCYVHNLYVKTVNDANGGGDAIHLSGNNNRITNCVVDNAQFGPTIDYNGATTGGEIDHNQVFAVNQSSISADRSAGSTSSGMLFHDNDMSWGANWDNPSVNQFHHNCFFVEINDNNSKMTGLQIYNNYCHGNPGTFTTGGVFLDSEGNGAAGSYTGALVYNNICSVTSTTNSPTNGCVITKANGGSPTVSLYNNTMNYVTANGGKCIMNQGAMQTFENNIFVNCGQMYFNSSGSLTLSDYNDFFGTTFFGPGASSNAAFSSWKIATGGDTHSTTSNPNLDSNFFLQSSSPAISTALNLNSLGITALDSDKAGVARPVSNPWDMGAYLFQASAAVVQLTPISLAFPNTIVSQSSPLTVTLKNTGGLSLTITSITLGGANPGSYSKVTTCGGSLPASASCTVTVTFSPASAASLPATLIFTTSAASSPDNLALTGTGTLATSFGTSATGSFTWKGNSALTAAPNANNTSGCSGGGALYAGCSHAFTGASDTNAANVGLQTVVVDAAPGNVSPISMHALIYPAWTGRILCHYMPWFYPGSPHITSPGMDETQQNTVTAQVQNMVARGCDAADIDWYGTAGPAQRLTVTSNMFTAAAGSSFKVAVTEDEGAVKVPCPLNGAGITQAAQVTCITNAINTDMDYIHANYAGNTNYLLSGSNPEVFFFLDLTDWSNPTLDSTHRQSIWTAVKAHTNAYAVPFKLLFEQGSFTTSPDGGGLTDGNFGWPQPYGYQIAKQLCWNIICPTFSATDYVGTLYTQFKASAKLGIGLLMSGFDDNIGSFGSNRVTAQRCGQTLLDSAAAFNTALSASGKTADIMYATWNDYEEGTEIETGINNCYTVSQSIVGNNLLPVLNKTDATYATINTIDHLAVYYTTSSGACANFCLAEDNISPTATPISLLGLLPSGVPVTVYTQAVGKPSILNQISAGTAYTAP